MSKKILMAVLITVLFFSFVGLVNAQEFEPEPEPEPDPFRDPGGESEGDSGSSSSGSSGTATRIGFEFPNGMARAGRYVVKDVFSGTNVAEWQTPGGSWDSGWLTDLEITGEETWVEVLYYASPGMEPINMRILNHAPETEYGWLARDIEHALQVEFPDEVYVATGAAVQPLTFYPAITYEQGYVVGTSEVGTNQVLLPETGAERTETMTSAMKNMVSFAFAIGFLFLIIGFALEGHRRFQIENKTEK